MMRQRRYLFALTAAVVALAVFVWVMNLNKRGGKVDDPIEARELPALLQFTYFDQAGWEERLKGVCSGSLSYRELELLLEELQVKDYVTYEKKAGFREVARKDFFQVYDQIVDLLDVEGRVSREGRIFIGDEAENGGWLTQHGFEGVAPVLEGQIRQYDMRQVYLIDGVITALGGPEEGELSWENVFIHEAEGGKADILFGGVRIQLDTPALDMAISDTVCDVVWKEGTISGISKKEDTIQGNVLSYNETEIEIEGYGILQHVEELPVYKAYGTLEELDISGLTIGNLMAEFVVAGQEVCGVVLKEPATADQIRVLLLNGEAPYREDVYVTAQEEFVLSWQDQQQTLAPGTLVQASQYLTEPGAGCLKLNAAAEGGCLYLADGGGQILSKGYQGILEIRRYGQGHCIVNELSMEDYLTAVVPSEMPASYEQEALRAQAVCARSYACIQLAGNEYAGFAANVDDSTNYQVYNKQDRDERTTRAVQDTFGQVVTYQGEVADTYYYSASCGFSQSSDIWDMAEGLDYGYLASVSLLAGEQPDISNEENFAAFIRDNSSAAYDSDSAYYRWRAQLDFGGSLEAVNEAARKRREVSPGQVQIFDANGNLAEVSLSELGNITGLSAEERSAGGALKKLRLQYEKGSVLLGTEYTIRRVLGAAAVSLTNKEEQPISGFNLLPSAAFTVVPAEQGYVLYGGGYGHGIGMSQTGANGMAKAGFSYQDILQKFYQNIAIENIYQRQES